VLVTLRATQLEEVGAAGVADKNEHGKFASRIKSVLDATKAKAKKLSDEADWVFGRRTWRVLGVVALFAIVVALLFLLLNWYVAPTKLSDKKDLVLALAQILGGTALLSGIYFTWRTLQVNREGQITDRFTRAIDQLGATHDDNSKNLELRLGGIYALERIARESEEDHWAIMEVLTAYVRQHAPREPAKSRGEDSPAGEASEERTGAETELAEVRLTPDPDIKAIVAVLRRRTRHPKPKLGPPETRRDYTRHGEPEPLDLSATELSGANFWHAYLRQDILSNARLRKANLSNADLSGAYLQGADLSEAYLPEADLSGAELQGADLHGAELWEANLQGATHTAEQLADPRSLRGATMPNGQKYEDWRKDQEGSGKDRANE
jgi:hypothetical protein